MSLLLQGAGGPGAPVAAPTTAVGQTSWNFPTLNPAYPVGSAAGDIAIIFATTRTANPLLTPTGYTQIRADASAGVYGTRIWVRKLDGSEGSNVTFADPGTRQAGTIRVYRGPIAAPVAGATTATVYSDANTPILPPDPGGAATGQIIVRYGGCFDQFNFQSILAGNGNGKQTAYDGNEPRMMSFDAAIGAAGLSSFGGTDGFGPTGNAGTVYV